VLPPLLLILNEIDWILFVMVLPGGTIDLELIA